MGVGVQPPTFKHPCCVRADVAEPFILRSAQCRCMRPCIGQTPPAPAPPPHLNTLRMQSVGRSQDGCAAYISAAPGCAVSTVSLAAVNGTNTKWLLSPLGTTGKFIVAMHVSVWW